MSYHIYQQYLEHYYENMNSNKMFVVAHCSLHTGSLEQQVVYAATELQAMCAFLRTDYADLNTLHESIAPDAWIGALEIHNTLTE